MLVLEVARARLSQPPSDVKIDDFSLSTDLNRGEKAAGSLLLLLG